MVAHNFKSLVGQTFNRLTVIERVENTKDGRARYLCRCSCGGTLITTAKRLRNKEAQSCGCLVKDNGKKKRLKLEGKIFGRLTVIELAYVKNHKTYWRCRCTCENETIVAGSSLTSNHVISCGCRKKETEQENCFKATHGLRGTRIYHTWRDMKNRCLNPNYAKFYNYGGRGITVCEEWKNNFVTFYNWAMANGYTDELTIERTDVNGNYCPENCTWIPMEKQCDNKRNTVRLTYKGETHTLKEWAQITGIPYCTLRSRHSSKKWTVERMLTQPKRP